MALIQTKREKMDETSAKNNGSYIPESSKSTGKRTYCILCRRSYAKHVSGSSFTKIFTQIDVWFLNMQLL